MGVEKCASPAEARESGGYRIITFYTGARLPVFLITVLSKGERSNLFKAESNSLRAITKAIVEEY